MWQLLQLVYETFQRDTIDYFTGLWDFKLKILPVNVFSCHTLLYFMLIACQENSIMLQWPVNLLDTTLNRLVCTGFARGPSKRFF